MIQVRKLKLIEEINHISPLDSTYSFALSTTNGVK